MRKLIAANDNNCGFYVYVWRRPCGEPFYVGKGKGRRAYDLYDRSKEFKDIHAQGGCSVDIVDWFIHESQALAYEIELISRYGRRDIDGVLVNKTDGGDGCSGHTKSAEAIAKWRAKTVGQSRSPDVKAKMSAAKMGHPVSGEARAKLSAAGKKRFEDPAERAKISARAANPSHETRRKMSESAKRVFADPQERERLRNYVIGKPMQADTRLKISISTKGVAKPVDAVANMRLAQRMKPPRGRFKGVSAEGRKWRAMISLDSKIRYLGSHVTEEDAARAYDVAAIEAYGIGGCYLNFPAMASSAMDTVTLAA